RGHEYPSPQPVAAIAGSRMLGDGALPGLWLTTIPRRSWAAVATLSGIGREGNVAQAGRTPDDIDPAAVGIVAALPGGPISPDGLVVPDCAVLHCQGATVGENTAAFSGPSPGRTKGLIVLDGDAAQGQRTQIVLDGPAPEVAHRSAALQRQVLERQRS